MPLFCTATAGGTLLTVRAAPRSSRTGLEPGKDALKVRVRAAPVDGKANREILETLSDAFGIPRSRVSFRSGETSKTKRLLLAGVGAEKIREVLG